MSLTYRDTKLSELEHEEVDENFRYLDQKSSEYVVGHVYRGPVNKIYNGQLYLLSPGVTFPFTAANFETELAAGNWQLVGSGTSYKGELNLITPVLENGTGTIGDYYKVVQDGDYDFGAGEVHYNNGDFVLYDGAVYGPYVDNNQLFSSLFNKKDFDKTQSFTATGTDVVIPFHLYGYGTIELSGALTSVSGFSFTDLIASPENAEYPHEGKEIVIINRSGHDITLKNADFASLAVVFFAFDGGNIVIPNNGKLFIKYTADGLIDILKSWTTTDEVIGLPEELDLKADKTYVDALVVGLWDDRGPHNASSNTFPSTGGSGTAGAIKKGDIWTISVAGTLGSEVVEIGDTVRALVDSPSTTPSNWAIQQNNIGYVPENSANKVTTMSGNTTSNIVFLTAKAVYDWAIGLFVPQTRTLTIGAETFDLSANRTFSGGGSLPKRELYKRHYECYDQTTGYIFLGSYSSGGLQESNRGSFDFALTAWPYNTLNSVGSVAYSIFHNTLNIQQQYSETDLTKIKGFYSLIVFKLNNYVSTSQRMLFGLKTDNQIFSNINPSEMNGALFSIGRDSGDANFSFFINPNSGAITKVDTGIPYNIQESIILEVERYSGGITGYIKVTTSITKDTFTYNLTDMKNQWAINNGGGINNGASTDIVGYYIFVNKMYKEI